jgi:N-acetyl-anhydromuramyl-L-alanine amidase AmpD
MIEKLLPAYCWSRKPLNQVDGIVIHYFSAVNVDPDNADRMDVCYNLFMDLNRPKARREFYMREDAWPSDRLYASAHILIGRGGEVWKLVPFDRRAHHAGVSEMNGRQHCNAWTLGIELIGTDESGFSKEQYEALADLLVELEWNHDFSRDNVQGHDTIRNNARLKGATAAPKRDPSGRPDGKGDNFDWWYLGKLWNDRKPNPDGVNTLADLEQVIEAAAETHNDSDIVDRR